MLSNVAKSLVVEKPGIHHCQLHAFNLKAIVVQELCIVLSGFARMRDRNQIHQVDFVVVAALAVEGIEGKSSCLFTGLIIPGRRAATASVDITKPRALIFCNACASVV
jgi:hypothetical protein